MLLSLFILFYTLEFVNDLIFHSGVNQSNARLLFLPINFFLLQFVIFWFYSLNLTGRWNFKKHRWHLIPGIVEFVLCSVLYFFPGEVKLSWYESGVLIPVVRIYSVLHIASTIIYCSRTLNLFKKHNILVSNYFSSTKSKTLKWIQVAAIFSIVFVILTDGYFLFRHALLPLDLRDIFIYLNLFYIFCIGLFGFKQLTIFNSSETKALIEDQHKEIESTSDKSTTSEYLRLIAFIENEKPYLRQDLVLSDLAKALNIKDRFLREIIQMNTGMHFNHFINKFRVEETKRLLVSTEFEHYTLLAVGQEAGFQAKTTFFTAFKYFENITPATYQKLMKKNDE